MFKNLVIVLLLFCRVSYADDIYLKTGFVILHVQVIDTTSGHINFIRDGYKLSIDTVQVLRIELHELLPEQKSSYEMFSKDLYDQIVFRHEQAELNQMQIIIDSIKSNEQHLDSIYTWRNSLYIASGYGTPQGFRFELGYNFQEIIAIALSFGIGDKWSSDPLYGTLAGLMVFHFPITSLPITPYLLICRGGGLTFFCRSDIYTLLYLGTMIELKSGIHLRPEFGVELTSRHVSGGPTLFGEESPEVIDEKKMLGVNITFEIDFMHAF